MVVVRQKPEYTRIHGPDSCGCRILRSPGDREPLIHSLLQRLAAFSP